jgi:PmbA protein
MSTMRPEQVFNLLQQARLMGDVYAVEKTVYGVTFIGHTLYTSTTQHQGAISVSVWQNSRCGYSTASIGSGVDLSTLVENASYAATLAQPIESFSYPSRIIPAAMDYPVVDETTRSDMAHFGIALLDAAESFYRRQCDLRLNLTIEKLETVVQLMNSAGGWGTYQQTLYRLDFSAAELFEDQYTVFQQVTYAKGLANQDPEVISRNTLTPLLHNHQSAEVSPGETEVIFMPSAFADLLSIFSCLWHGELAKQHLTPLIAGTQVFDSRMTLHDSGVISDSIRTRPFDAEGTTTQNTLLVEDGVQHHFFHDRKSAGENSTGNSYRDFIKMPELTLNSFVISPGDATLHEAIASVQHGLIIYDIIGTGYTSVLSGDFSVKVTLGYTIEYGEITGRVRNAVLYGNFIMMLNRVLHLGNCVQQQQNIYTPFVHCEGVSVEGKERM